MRKGLLYGSELDQVLQSLRKTILAFFAQVEEIDLVTLRCDGNDPNWLRFRDALAALRKSVGLQLFYLCNAYGVVPNEEIARLMPQPD